MAAKQASRKHACASPAQALSDTASRPEIALAEPLGSPDRVEPLELPDSAVRKYLARFGVGAVYIVAGTDGFPCVIGSGTDLADELKAARSTWPAKLDPPVLVAAWWCFDLRTAQQICNLVLASDLRLATRNGPRFAVTVSEATTAITAAAGRLRFRLTDHASVLARAKAAGSSMEDKLTAAQDAGGLREFNQEYSRRRREAAARGEQFMSYNVARARLRATLAAAASGKAIGDIMGEVFGAGS